MEHCLLNMNFEEISYHKKDHLQRGGHLTVIIAEPLK